MDKITLEAARVNAKLRIEDVAQKIGRAPATISAWENGAEPKITDALKLCEIYGADIYRIAWKEDKK